MCDRGVARPKPDGFGSLLIELTESIQVMKTCYETIASRKKHGLAQGGGPRSHLGGSHMETWGELFWDAWIRFRLWCRTLRRMYWPPRIEAWQVCTVTGVAAIVLTVLSLRNQQGSTALAGQPASNNAKAQAAAVPPSAKKSQKKLASTPAVDPYQTAQIVDGATAVEEEITLEGKSSLVESNLDPEFADIGPSTSRKRDLRQATRPGKLTTALDTPPPEPADIDTANMSGDESPKATANAETDSEFRSRSSTVPEPAEFDETPRANTTSNRAETKPVDDEFEPAAELSASKAKSADQQIEDNVNLTPSKQPDSAIPNNAAPHDDESSQQSAVKPQDARTPGHYARPHHEHEEPTPSDMPVARIKKSTFTAPPPTPKSLARKKGHYSGFGDDDESKADTAPQPKRTNAVPPSPPEASEPDVVEPTTPQADPNNFEEPKVAQEPEPREPAPSRELPTIEQPAFEQPARELPLPPSEADAAADQPLIQEAMIEPEVDESPRPPILFAPEPEESIEESASAPLPQRVSTRNLSHAPGDDEDTSPKRKMPSVVQQLPPMETEAEDPVTPAEKPPQAEKPYHGPVLSTESADHESHSKEDVFNGGKRKQRNLPDLTRPKPAEYHGPVLSTGATDHEAHQDEDSIASGTSKSKGSDTSRPWPMAKVVKPSQEHQARQPVSTEQVDTEPPIVEKAAPAVDSEYEPAEGAPAVVPPHTPVEPMKSPVSGETAEPITARRTTPRTAPRVIRYDEEEPSAAPAVTRKPESETETPTPMPELTQARGPARISIPQRVPQPEETEKPATTAPRARAPVTPPPMPPATAPRTRAPQAPVAPAERPIAAPRLEMEITGPRKAPMGTQVVLHFKIKNVGNAVVTGIMVSDVLPPGLQHRLSPDLEYSIPRLAPGEAKETNLTVLCTAPGVITNRAALTADGDVTAEASVQVEVTASVPAAGGAAATRSPLTVTHRGPEHWLVDSTGQFLVTVTNVSGQHLRDVTITETYPAETNLLHATVGHKADAQNRTVCWTITDFAPGQAYILETELHSTKSGPQTTSVKVKVAGTDVAEDRWTAVSYPEAAMP
jgi:uncharacterized repeat protein (TIGR01451 family)